MPKLEFKIRGEYCEDICIDKDMIRGAPSLEHLLPAEILNDIEEFGLRIYNGEGWRVDLYYDVDDGEVITIKKAGKSK
jgi:hypothetical protein